MSFRSLSALQAQRLLLVPIAISAAALLLLVFTDSSRLVSTSFPGFLFWDNGVLISLDTPTWSGAQSGLALNRGRIVSVDGRPFTTGSELLAAVSDVEPGVPVRYRFSSRGEEIDYVVPVMQLSWLEYAEIFGAYLFSSFFFFAIAIIALYLRPDLPAARALALAMGGMGLLLVLSTDVLTTYRFVVACQVIEAATPLAIFHFGLVFPVERFTRAGRRLILGGVAVGLAVVLGAEITLFRERPEVVHRLALLVYSLMALSPLVLLANVTDAFVRAGDVPQRLQAGVVLAGGAAAFMLPASMILGFVVLDYSFPVTWIVLPLAVFPVSVLYAVVRHDLLRAERLVRLTLGYALATSTLTVGYVSIVGLLDAFVSPRVSVHPASAFLLLLAIAISFDPLRRRVQAVVDRLFFRSDIDAGRILEASSAGLAGLLDEPAIARFVEARLQNELALHWVEYTGLARVRPDASLVEPVQSRGQQLAVLACGPKRSGAPYSPTERSVVKGMADQSALALRNARSIHELRETQAALLHSERFAAIGEFAGAVAHGIRNPLAGIRAATQLAYENSGGGLVAETLSSALTEADRLDQRIRSLLDFSRPIEPVMHDVELLPLLEAVARVLDAEAGRENVTIHVAQLEGPLVVRADANYLEEAILELTANAVRATPNGGEVRLEAKRLGQDRASVVISDTGPGIPPGIRDRVFDLFFTTRQEGTGIGLATVKKILDQLGGAVELVDSGPAGTTMRIDLELARRDDS